MVTDIRTLGRLLLGAALVLAVMTTAARAAEGDPATPAPTPPAAGACVHPELADGPAVSYRFKSRANTWRARAVTTGTIARRFPAVAAAKVGVLGTTTLHSHQAAWYFVLDAKQVGETCWLRLRLPAMPNDKAGWVNRDELVAERTRFQIEVDLSDRRVRVYAGTVLKLNAKVVIGKAATPTPKSPAGAPFAMYDAVAGKASQFEGTWQLATTAMSPQVPSMGRVGLHGRGGASLDDPLGTAASHGCVRLANSTIDSLVRMIGLSRLFGVPVIVQA